MINYASILSLLFLLSCNSALNAQPSPTEKDLVAAQTANHSKETNASPKAIVACNSFTGFKVIRVSNDGIADVRYDEYRSDTTEISTKPMTATLRFDRKKWNWIKGDPPRCAYATFDIDLSTPSNKK